MLIDEEQYYTLKLEVLNYDNLFNFSEYGYKWYMQEVMFPEDRIIQENGEVLVATSLHNQNGNPSNPIKFN